MVFRPMLTDDVSRRLEEGTLPRVKTGRMFQRCFARCVSKFSIVEGFAEAGRQARQLTPQVMDVGIEHNGACQHIAIPIGDCSSSRGIASRFARLIHERDELGVVSTHCSRDRVMWPWCQGRRTLPNSKLAILLATVVQAARERQRARAGSTLGSVLDARRAPDRSPAPSVVRLSRQPCRAAAAFRDLRSGACCVEPGVNRGPVVGDPVSSQITRGSALALLHVGQRHLDHRQLHCFEQ